MSSHAIDPEFLDALRSAPTSPDDVDAPRRWLRQVQGDTLIEGDDTGSAAGSVQITDWSIPGPNGDELGVRVFAPADTPLHMPAVLYCHGGAFSVNDPDLNTALCVDIAVSCECAVLLVDYRLAPVDPFPAAFDDCYAALVWAAAQAAMLGIDASRLAVAGASAGGGLAAAVALAARDRGGPSLVYQQLVYPVIDDRMQTESSIRFTDTPVLNRPAVVSMWDRYLGDRHAEPSAYAAPGRASDLGGLAAAYVEVAEFDPLRDEGIDYAARLLAAGVPTELHLHAGTFHGSMMIGSASVTQRATAVRHAALRRAFALAGG